VARSQLVRTALLAVALASTLGARAHHSIAGVYDTTRTTTIEARVIEFRFVNPHPIIVVEVASPPGVQTWQLELDNRFELVAIGMDEATLAPGDDIVAAGSLGRADAQRLYVRRLERPADGLLYEQRGMTPSLVRRGLEAR
jgi:Uma2 family endonuclease